MSLKIAVTGFQHGHIFSLVSDARKLGGFEIVAACEEDPVLREKLRGDQRVTVTHDNFQKMLDEVPCDIVATGESFGKRGRVLIEALARGKHVICDKPICTKHEELAEIERLAAAGDLKVGCMLTLRDSGKFREIRRLLRAGEIGDVQSVAFGGQHPMSADKRPDWYFQPGGQGGTINDIGIHAIDLIPWLTGHDFSTVIAARTWNAFLPGHPDFCDGAQFMAALDNGCGVLGDVSYFAPEKAKRPIAYWRFSFFGSRGFLEGGVKLDRVTLVDERGVQEFEIPDSAWRLGSYLADFRSEITGSPAGEEALDTPTVIRAARQSLLVQKAADEKIRDLPLARQPATDGASAREQAGELGVGKKT